MLKGYEYRHHFYSEEEFCRILGTFSEVQQLLRERIALRKLRQRQRKLRHRRRLVLTVLIQAAEKLMLLTEHHVRRGEVRCRLAQKTVLLGSEPCAADIEQKYFADVSIMSSLISTI